MIQYLRFFEQHTRIYAAAYSDSRCLVEFDQPIVSDSEGNFPDIYFGSGKYTFELSNCLVVLHIEDFEIDPIFTELYEDWAKTLTDKQIEELKNG